MTKKYGMDFRARRRESLKSTLPCMARHLNIAKIIERQAKNVPKHDRGATWNKLSLAIPTILFVGVPMFDEAPASFQND